MLDERLYHASVDDLMDVITSMEGSLNWVACVGHNPGMTDLANHLGRKRFDNVPTCGVVEMGFDTDQWIDIEQIAPSSVDFEFPKKHRLQ